MSGTGEGSTGSTEGSTGSAEGSLGVCTEGSNFGTNVVTGTKVLILSNGWFCQSEKRKEKIQCMYLRINKKTTSFVT